MKNSTIAFRIVVLGLLLLFSCAPKHSIVLSNNGIQTDPAVVYGILPNGFKYFLMENSTPEDRVNIHLDVFAGSMNETNEQQGV
ncbi:MAG: hypothetical protein KAJ25_02835, partial [Desulfobacula sp.]|nr:hypothetical protein [Desulfobacula sp.]